MQSLGHRESGYEVDRVCDVSASLLKQPLCQRRSIEEHLSPGRTLSPFCDHVQEASLSAALGPENSHYLSTVQGQVRALQDQGGSVTAQTSSGVHLQKCNQTRGLLSIKSLEWNESGGERTATTTINELISPQPCGRGCEPPIRSRYRSLLFLFRSTNSKSAARGSFPNGG